MAHLSTHRFIRSLSCSCRVLVVGTGTAGLAVSSKLSRSLPSGSVTLLDSRQEHYNQPLWTLVGAGIKKLSDSKRDTRALIPKGVTWVCESAASFDPANNCVTTSSGQKITYEYLVLALGINVDFGTVDGLVDALKDQLVPVSSNYSHQTAEKTWQCIQNFSGGNALFTFPNTPVKCAGAPQKVMYLADDHFRTRGIRSKTKIAYYSALSVIFSAPKYAERLTHVIQNKEIDTFFRHNLVRVNGIDRIATFKVLSDGSEVQVPFDFLHVTPPQSAPKALAPFADATGFVDIDKHTMRSKKQANVFAVGDCSNAPTSKTAAAVSSQSQVVFQNLMALIDGKEMLGTYDGYTSCPLLTSYKSVILAEFDYDLKPKETFFVDQGKERLSMFWIKRDIIPPIYWNMLITGRWNGPAKYRRFLNPFSSG